MLQVHTRRAAPVAVLAMIAALFGCEGSPSSPGGRPEITNKPNYFAYQVTGIRNYSGYDFFTWENRGTTVNVEILPAQVSGGALIVVADADGRPVFAERASASGSFPSAEGTPGWWTVRLYYASFTGTVTFDAEGRFQS